MTPEHDQKQTHARRRQPSDRASLVRRRPLSLVDVCIFVSGERRKQTGAGAGLRTCGFLSQLLLGFNTFYEKKKGAQSGGQESVWSAHKARLMRQWGNSRAYKTRRQKNPQNLRAAVTLRQKPWAPKDEGWLSCCWRDGCRQSLSTKGSLGRNSDSTRYFHEASGRSSHSVTALRI